MEVNNEEWVSQIAKDYTKADLTPLDKALCDYAAKLTRTPSEMTKADIVHLRSLELSDRAIGDATQVISFFNYINRIADGLGVDPEENMTFTRE